MNPLFTMDDVRTRTYKARDAWWTVFLVDPLAGRLVRFTANRTPLTPDQVSLGALLLGLGAAGCFWTAGPWLIIGAVLYHLSFVLDCVDGKLARLTGTGTVFGGWLDYVFDRIRVLACAVALTAGQYAATGRPEYLGLGIGIVFLDMLRYLDALKVAAVRREMNGRLRHAVPGDGPERPPVDLQRGFRRRFSWYLRVRDWLLRHRVRTHLVSGIEFQMAVFIVGPLCHAIIPVTVVAGALMLVFEVGIVYKLWLSSKDFTQALGEVETSRAPV
ncbi:CDP-alcohol phosphatidyltransferase family protein [Actinoallomurus acaciae]|uniref:CDP-alcohol phosphatidyltransferase family protein n=1 Tax=Actinoallomurus acaciae TaxID=502577 RepID=A0ABV5YWC7_9ACTN